MYLIGDVVVKMQFLIGSRATPNLCQIRKKSPLTFVKGGKDVIVVGLVGEISNKIV